MDETKPISEMENDPLRLYYLANASLRLCYRVASVEKGSRSKPFYERSGDVDPTRSMRCSAKL